MNVTCPECDATLSLAAGAQSGEIVQCADCGADLEVMSLNPPELALAETEEEDWGDDQK